MCILSMVEHILNCVITFKAEAKIRLIFCSHMNNLYNFGVTGIDIRRHCSIHRVLGIVLTKSLSFSLNILNSLFDVCSIR